MANRFPPTSPGPARSPTDISLAHLQHIPTYQHEQQQSPGEGSTSLPAVTGQPPQTLSQNTEDQPGLGIQHASDQVPPPDYTSPEGSDDGRRSEDSERQPLVRPRVSPPIPSYSDAVAASGVHNSTSHDDDVD